MQIISPYNLNPNINTVWLCIPIVRTSRLYRAYSSIVCVQGVPDMFFIAVFALLNALVAVTTTRWTSIEVRITIVLSRYLFFHTRVP